MRLFVGRGDGSPYKEATLGTADDQAAANGEKVLSYAQAVERAQAWSPDAPDESSELLTVADVVTWYLAWATEHRPRSAGEMRYGLEAHVVPKLGEIPVAELTTERLRRWHTALAKKAARVRTSKHEKQRYRRPQTEDEKRARRATANRILVIFRAALNRAWRDGKISGTRDAWQRVEAFRNVERSRARYLETGEIERLINAIDEPDFRDLVTGAIATGCRYQELARLCVADVQLDAAAVQIRESKSGRPRSVFLNDEGVAFFESLTAGRPASELVFSRDGSPWGKSEQQHRTREACEAAGIDPVITFHGLRHTYASLYLMYGGGLPDLAKQLGHSTTRMCERHYSHLADSWRAERARKFAPKLGIKPGNVRRMAKHRDEAQVGRATSPR